MAIRLQRQFDNQEFTMNNERTQTSSEDQIDSTVIDLTSEIDSQSVETNFNERAESEVEKTLFQRPYIYYQRQGWKSEDCSICCETFQPMNENILLSCDHRYHAACIRSWFTNAAEKRCPLCRAGPYY